MASRTLQRRASTDPRCPNCGHLWDEATTFSGDAVEMTTRRWTLPCGHRVVLPVSSFRYPEDSTNRD